MKNILKKIGLIAIIVGVLAPFITLPNVNAANETCEYYLNQYLFLDVFTGSSIDSYQLGGGKEIGKRNFTNFMYTFPELASGETLEIVKTGNVNLTRTSGIREYYNAYGLFYGEDSVLDRWERMDIDIFGAWTENASRYGEGNITTLVHGIWAHDGDDEEDREAQTSTWPEFDDAEDFESQTIQYAIENSDEDVELNTRLGGASLYESRSIQYFEIASRDYRHDVDAYMDLVISDYNSKSSSATSYTRNYLIEGSNNETYFNLNILREIDDNDLEKLDYGLVDANTNKVLSTTQNGITDSYQALLNYKDNGNSCEGSHPCYLVNGSFDININESYYWPALYNIEYKVCSAASTPSASWTLTYDRGVSGDEVANVTSMPDNQSGLTTTSVTLSTKKPERKDYEFKSWCTEKDGKGTCVEAGKVFENKSMTNKTVYAYWVKPGTAPNEKQGVMSYVLGFAGVGIIACGLYYVINKKNLFKQI